MTVRVPKQTGSLFSRKHNQASLNRTPDRESLAADLNAFEQAGGVIEKLGTTCMFKHLPATEGVHAAPARTPSKAKSGPN